MMEGRGVLTAALCLRPTIAMASACWCAQGLAALREIENAPSVGMERPILHAAGDLSRDFAAAHKASLQTRTDQPVVSIPADIAPVAMTDMR